MTWLERVGLERGECLCAGVALVGVFVALWLLSCPGPPPHGPMRLRGPWHEGNIT